MKLILKGIEFLRINGIFLFFTRIFYKCINFLYIILVFKRLDVDIDYSAKIRGINCIKIGKNFHAGKNLWLDAVVLYEKQKFSPRLIIGDNVSVQDFVHIGATNYVEIGNNVLFASKVYVTDHNHGIYDGDIQSSPEEPPYLRKLTNDKEVVIGYNVWVGEGVTILPGVHIGKCSIIGSNAVVSKNIPEFSIAVGAPARVIKRYDKELNNWINV